MVYILVFILLSFLIYYYDIKGNENRKDFWYGISLFSLVLLSGLRYRIGGDTIAYMHNFYYETPFIWDLSWSDIKDSSFEPFFVLLTSTVKTLCGKFFVFQLLHAVFVNGLIFSYIRKHCNQIFTCILFYYLWMYALYNFEEIRASMSLALCLFANDYILEKKWIKGFCLYFIGCMFHYSTFIILLTPLLFFLRMNLIGITVLILSLVGGYLIKNNFNDYLLLLEFNDYASEKASMYAQSETYFQNSKNIRVIILTIVPYVLYSFFSFLFLKRQFSENNQKEISLLRFQPVIIIGLSFQILSISMPICYRFFHFYIIYFIMFFSNFFIGLIKKDIQLSVPIALIRSIILFIPIFNIFSHIYRYPTKESTKSNIYYDYEKYYPYSSVLERSVSERRENIYRNLGSIMYYIQPKESEY